MAIDLTRGNPLKLIVKFLIPLILSSIFQIFYNMADSVIVGKFVSTEAMAAVGSTGSVNFFFLGFLTGLSTGFGIPISSSFGAKDFDSIKKYVFHSIVLSCAVSLLITLITAAFLTDILALLQTPEEIFAYCYDYLLHIFLGVITMTMYSITAGILRAVGDSRTPLVCLILSSIINILLNLLFVCVFEMEVVGVAVATNIAQLFSAAYCAVEIYKKHKFLIPGRRDCVLKKNYTAKLFSYGIPMGFQFSITAIGAIAVQTSVNMLGTASVAAVAAAGKVRQFTYQTMNSVGITIATFNSQNLGAKQTQRISQGTRICFGIMAVISLLSAAIILLFGKEIVLMFLDEYNEEIISKALFMLYVGMILYIFLGIVYLFRNAVQGLGYATVAVIAGVFELVARCATAAFLTPIFGYEGICFADPLAWIAADMFLVPVYIFVMKKIKRVC